MSILPTIRVVNPSDPAGGHMIINESDFDADVHERFDKVGTECQSDGRGVHSENSIWYAFNNGAWLPGRFDSEESAWSAIGGKSEPYRNPSGAALNDLVSDEIRVHKSDGKWFVWRGREKASIGFDTEAEAQDAATAPDNHSADDAGAEPLPLCVVKGPRGKWYVKRGPMKVGGKNAFESDGFESREEADAALDAMTREATSQ